MLIQGDLPGHHPVHGLSNVVQVPDVLEPKPQVFSGGARRRFRVDPGALPVVRTGAGREPLRVLDGVLDLMYQGILRRVRRELFRVMVLVSAL